MNTLIDLALKNSRTVLLGLGLILGLGLYSFFTLPREFFPDIAVPIVNITINHKGISPQDADKLIVNPLENKLRHLEGLKETRSIAYEGKVITRVEFQSDINISKALLDVREEVDLAKIDFPPNTDEPIVEETNVSLFPILLINLSGNVDHLVLYRTAKRLKDKLEMVPGVLSTNIRGNREEVTEVIIDPIALNNYNLSQEDLFDLFANNHQLVASGTLDSGAGRFPIKVPGLVNDAKDLLNLPLKINGNRIVRVQDVAVAFNTFKDPTDIARIQGRSTVTLEVRKRLGSNVINVIEEVKAETLANQKIWPDSIILDFVSDESIKTKVRLADLQNSVMTSTLLVMIVVLCTLGIRSALLVAIAIPGSFLISLLCIDSFGFTLNNIVLFALILAVGMLVDGAIVVTEYADRRMKEGAPRRQAFGDASKRMAWPITASTATTLAAFLPLLFWPDTVGQFMKYIPITLSTTMAASLFMALIAIPVIGSIALGRKAMAAPSPNASPLPASIPSSNDANSEPIDKSINKPIINTNHYVNNNINNNANNDFNNNFNNNTKAAEHLSASDLLNMGGILGHYVRTLNYAVNNPYKILTIALGVLVAVITAYHNLGRGVEFFPETEPEAALVYIMARGDMSIYERDEIVRVAEELILPFNEIKSVYATAITQPSGNAPRDTIGIIQLELKDWSIRRPADEIIKDIKERLSDIAGVKFEVQKKKNGPSKGKPIQLTLRHNDIDQLSEATENVKAWMETQPSFYDIQDTRPLPGIEWQMKVDRAMAARYDANILQIGAAVKLVTNGIMMAEYLPKGAVERSDIIVRLPKQYRHITQLQNLTLPINGAIIPLSNFVDFYPAPKESLIARGNGMREYVIDANVTRDRPMSFIIKELLNYADKTIPPQITYYLGGDQEKQGRSQAFLIRAFVIAIFLMTIILVTQFNSFYQAFLILTSVIFSIIGVLIVLIIRQQPFGVIMSGIGVIALAGIVVNNNIVLIDTYNILRRGGLHPTEAALRTGVQRIRPVMLTTVTTILGLIPMAYQVSFNFVARQTNIGSPTSQYWSELATTIAGGLGFATILTLILTPVLLVLGDRRHAFDPSHYHAPGGLEGGKI